MLERPSRLVYVITPSGIGLAERQVAELAYIFHRELVGSNRSVVVPIGGVAQMAAAMDRLLQDPETRSEMGDNGRREMVERNSLGLIIGEHELLCGQLLDESRGRRCGGENVG
jgi:glycosyltransferase involved in cell wall biosynthesis